MGRSLAVLGATVALAVPVGLSAAPPATAADYPAKVKREYMKGCVKGAKEEGASTKKAKAYCRASLRCLESRLTLKEFKELGQAINAGDKTPPHNKDLKACQKQAAKVL